VDDDFSKEVTRGASRALKKSLDRQQVLIDRALKKSLDRQQVPPPSGSEAGSYLRLNDRALKKSLDRQQVPPLWFRGGLVFEAQRLLYQA